MGRDGSGARLATARGSASYSEAAARDVGPLPGAEPVLDQGLGYHSTLAACALMFHLPTLSRECRRRCTTPMTGSSTSADEAGALAPTPTVLALTTA